MSRMELKDFVTFTLMNMEHSVKHRSVIDKVRQRSQKNKESQNGIRQLKAISIRCKALVVQIYGDSKNSET